jgi:DNA-binding transcriptional LysR family regulator
LPEIVARFQRAYPGVRVSIELATSARAVESLRSHHAEFAVVGGFAAAPEIEAEPLVEDEIVVVGPPQLARRRMSRRDAESAT